MRAWLFTLLGLLGVAVVGLAALVAVALYTEPFEPWRRAQAEALLDDALEITTKVSGPVEVSLGLNPRVVISDVSSVDTRSLPDIKKLSARKVDFNASLLALLGGDVVIEALFVEGLRVDLELPEADEDHTATDPSAFIHDFVRLSFSDNLSLEDFRFNYADLESGWSASYLFRRLGVHRQNDSIVIDGVGKIDDLPLKLNGTIDPSTDQAGQHAFSVSGEQAGIKLQSSGVYRMKDEQDEIQAHVTAHSASLSTLLDVYNVRHDFDGTGDLTFRLDGPLGSAAVSALDLNLRFETGDTLQMTGNIGDAIKHSGIDVQLTGSLVPPPPVPGAKKPIYDLNVTGFSGRIAGSIDGLLVRDLRIATNSLKAQLHDIGPISAERVWKDPEGRIGLYDVVVLAGPAQRPSVRVQGDIKDILQFQGVSLKGEIDFKTADVVLLEAEDTASQLGRLQGELAISDADGSIGIETLKARVTGTDLISMNVAFIVDDLRAGDEIKLKTSLKIPSFKKFSAALGSDVEDLGAVSFEGNVSGADDFIEADGVSVVGKTTLTGKLIGSNADGIPLLKGSVSTPLLHLDDVRKIMSIRSVYLESRDDKDDGDDGLDLSKIEKTIELDMNVDVEKIEGGRGDASSITGRVRYKDGEIALRDILMKYLGGRVSLHGKVITSDETNSFSLAGKVSRLRIGTVLQRLDLKYPISGILGMDFALEGKGKDKASISKTLTGQLAATLRNGKIGTGLIDLAGLNFPTWLFARHSRNGESELVCVVAPFSFHNGLGRTLSLVLETPDVQVRGAGFIDLGNQSISMQFRPQPLHSQLINIVKPFSIKGSLTAPRVRMEGSPAAKVATEVITFPLNLIGTLLEPLDQGTHHVPCRRVEGR